MSEEEQPPDAAGRPDTPRPSLKELNEQWEALSARIAQHLRSLRKAHEPSVSCEGCPFHQRLPSRPLGFPLWKAEHLDPEVSRSEASSQAMAVDLKGNAVGAPLRKLSGDPDCKNGTCPTLWVTDDGKDYVVQGYAISDPERLARLDLPQGETAVVVPAAVLEGYFRARR